jgi:hypothetical protein
MFATPVHTGFFGVGALTATSTAYLFMNAMRKANKKAAELYPYWLGIPGKPW